MSNNINRQDAVNPCTGCSMCYAICPKDAITVSLNADGFYIPVINDSKCVNCGLCQKVCYRFDFETRKGVDTPLLCYSAINRSDDELKAASSGAVSIELMRQCLSLGYYVVGVAYDTMRQIAVTRIAYTEKDLAQFRGSKYFQSFTAKAFKEIIVDKSEQKYAIFGTPCQIYAFSKVAELRGNRSKYILVDIFCHGCPSFNLWKKYLEYNKNKFGETEFDSIQFRSKTHGWHEFCFDFKNNAKQYSSSKYSDPFYEMFFSMDVMNQACFGCAARSSVEKTDIRLGDFWGRRFDEDTKGVSAVIIQTAVGESLFESVRNKFSCESMDFNEVIAAQSYGKPHSINMQARLQSLRLLNSSLSMIEITRLHRKLMPTKTRVKNLIKNILKHLPQNIYIKIRAVVHQG